MDHRLLLVKAITLLYRESTQSSTETNSSDLIRTALAGMKLPEVSLSMSAERQTLLNLRDTALYMCDNPADHTYDKEDLLQRLKVNCGDDERLYEAFSQGVERDMEEAATKRAILSMRAYINNTFRETEIIGLFSKHANQLRFQRETIGDVRNFVQNFKLLLEPYEMQVKGKDPAIVSMVDLGDTASLTTALTEIEELSNDISIMRFGWQGFNRMTQGGLRRGETVCIAALPHNYKTGLGLSLFKQIALYNKPHLVNPTKKPLLLRISFEDSTALNIQFLYQNLFQHINGEMPKMRGMKADVMGAFVKKQMEVNGYQVKMYRVDPSSWTYRDIQNLVISLEAEGYEIHLLALDYLGMVPTTGCIEGAQGDSMRDMWRRMRNFCSAKGIALMSPHQLSSDARNLVREGRSEFIKQVPGKGYYDGCRRLDQELDLEIFTHIEKVGEDSFLTIARGKHRIPSVIEEWEKYMVLPFTHKGCIMDDINGPEATLKKPGGAPRTKAGRDDSAQGGKQESYFEEEEFEAA